MFTRYDRVAMGLHLLITNVLLSLNHWIHKQLNKYKPSKAEGY